MFVGANYMTNEKNSSRRRILNKVWGAAKIREIFAPFMDIPNEKSAALFNSTTQELTAGQTSEEICQSIVNRINTVFEFDLIELWSIDPRLETLILVSRTSTRPLVSPIIRSLSIASSVTGESVESGMPILLKGEEIRNRPDNRTFVNVPMLDELRPHFMLSVPVLNISNPHQVLFVLNFYSATQTANSFLERLMSNVDRFAQSLALSLETNLRERCIRVSNELSKKLLKKGGMTTQSVCELFATTVQSSLQSDWVSVYLDENTDRDHEETEGTLRLRAHASFESLSSEETLTSRASTQTLLVRKSNREYLAQEPLTDEEHYGIAGEAKKQIHSALFFPLHDVAGKCCGVVRCVNFHKSETKKPWRRAFTYDDVAIIESMSQSFAPTLDMLNETEKRDQSLLTLAHELRVPVVAFRAVLERMEFEYKESDFRFSHPHFTEVQTYLEIMQRVLKEMEIVRTGPDRIQIHYQWTSLHSDVINPAIRFMRPLLRNRGFRREQLVHEDFEGIRRVQLDRALVTQIVFNLLENAIKYFPPDRPVDAFQCEVKGRILRGSEQIEIEVSDNGGGIAVGDEELIFQYGFRGQDAIHSGVEGTGFGLWYSREIAKRHQGSLTLKSPRNPTTFLLTLPAPRMR